MLSQEQDKILKIYYEIDEFVKVFDNQLKTRLLSEGEKPETRGAKNHLSVSEILTIVIYFHHSSFRTFKDYYTILIQYVFKKEFPGLPSYNRFVEIQRKAIIYLFAYLSTEAKAKISGISFVDSVTIKVCNNRRIHSNRVFKGIAERGHSSMGFFFGFKLHFVINHLGEIISFVLTKANCDDRQQDVMEILTKELFGKLFGDRGYIKQKLFEELLQRGIELITRVKKNMKNKLMKLFDKYLLRKRAVIEAVNDQLKNLCYLEHTRHRSPINFLVNLLSCLAAYSFRDKKPSVKFSNDEEILLLQSIL